MNSDPSNLPEVIQFLNVGTRILLKDIMDQYLRTLGEHRTFYAENMTWARRTLSERPIDVVIAEMELVDGSAFRLAKFIREEFSSPDLYIILAAEEGTQAVAELADEMEANAILLKPITAATLRAQVEKYQLWVKTQREPWRLLIREARKAAKEKRFREAEQRFKDAIEKCPNHPIPQCALGIYYLGKPDFKLAEKHLRAALEIKPNYVQAVSAMGLLHLAKHELTLAEKFLLDAQKLSPLNPDRLLKIARLNVDRAQDFCKSSLQTDPSSVAARLQLGKILAFQKDYVAAVKEFERVIPSLPEGKERNEAMTYLALSRKLSGIAKE